MAVTRTFKGSASPGWGYYAYIEDGELVVGESWPREGGDLFRGSYSCLPEHILEELNKQAPKLYKSITTYFENHTEKPLFRFTRGQWVEVKLPFGNPEDPDTPGFKAQVILREMKDGEPKYRLKNFTGWWPENTLQEVNRG